MIRGRQTIAETTAPTINKTTQSNTVQQGLFLLNQNPAQNAVRIKPTQQLKQQSQTVVQSLVQPTPSPELSSDIYDDDHDIFFEEIQLINFEEEVNYGYTPITVQHVQRDIKNEILQEMNNNNNLNNVIELDLDLIKNQHHHQYTPSQMEFDIADLPF